MENSVMYDYNIVCIGQKERTVYEAFEPWTRPYHIEWSALWAVKGRWYRLFLTMNTPSLLQSGAANVMSSYGRTPISI